MPLVRYVGGTWRTGGILALSRAFGDAYLKGSGQFEGVPSGSDGYSSGFGVIADPTVALTPLTGVPPIPLVTVAQHVTHALRHPELIDTTNLTSIVLHIRHEC